MLYDLDLEQINNYGVPVQEQTTRSGRPTREPKRLQFIQHFLFTRGHLETEYTKESAMVIAKTIHHYNNMLYATSSREGCSFLETFSLKKGSKQFGEKGYNAAFDEICQLHEQAVFKPINVKDLPQLERKRAMESLNFLVEKRDGRIKARDCSNGSTQREYINKEDYASPTVATESILLTAEIEAEEGRDVRSADIPNAFVQTNM
jgi:hypothetical protein